MAFTPVQGIVVQGAGNAEDSYEHNYGSSPCQAAPEQSGAAFLYRARLRYAVLNFARLRSAILYPVSRLLPTLL